MKQATYLRKTSLSRLFVHFVLMLIIINVASFTITLLEGNPRFFLTEYSWTLQFVFPVLYTFAQHLLNSNTFIRPEKRNIPNVFLTEQAVITTKKEQTQPFQQKLKHVEPNTKTNTLKKMTTAE